MKNLKRNFRSPTAAVTFLRNLGFKPAEPRLWKKVEDHQVRTVRIKTRGLGARVLVWEISDGDS
jgi:hypothetical protein